MASTGPRLYSGAEPAQVAADLAPLVAFERDGLPLVELERLVEERLVPHLMRYDRPAFQSMFNTFPDPAARLGAAIALDYNQGVTNWQVSPGGAMLEELCCGALCRLFALGVKADATFMYSGTYANQEALYLALHRHAERCGFDLAQEGLAGFEDPRRLLVITSQDAHFSIRHAVRLLGLGEQSLLLAPVDARRRIDVDALRRLIADLRGRETICLVATAGTTSTGAVDPIAPLVELADQTGAWLHVDGAYGYAYKLVPAWAPLFAGDADADSITWDPHKALGAPIPSSLLFVRRRQDFARMALFSGYFNRAGESAPNPGLKSPPSTRPLAALPLAATLRGRGLDRVVEDLYRPLAAVQELYAYLLAQPAVEVCHPPDTGILCFRMTPEDVLAEQLNTLQRWLADRLLQSGERAVSVTQLDGRTALRVVSVAPQTTFAHLRETIDVLQEEVEVYRRTHR